MLVGFLIFAVIVIAFVCGLFLVLEYYPNSFLVLLLTKHREIAGPVLATGIAIIAAGAAFISVQTQIGVQQRATRIAELTFWQNERNNAEITLEGLAIVREAADQVAKAFANPIGNPPYLTALVSLQPSGTLDLSQWPPTGRSLVNWEMNKQISVLRIWFNKLAHEQDAGVRASGETEIKAAVNRILSVRGQLDRLSDAAKIDRDRAEKILKEFDRQSL